MPFLIKRRKYSPKVIRKARHNQDGQDALDRLNAFLHSEEPDLVRLLTSFWGDQQRAITYKEIRTAIENGYMDLPTLEAWQQDYARFVNEKLNPIWTSAMEYGAAKTAARHPDFFFDPMARSTRDWISQHGAELVTNITEDQRQAIAAMINRSISEGWSTDELARAIRPTIGLTKQQTAANLKYYQHVKSSLLENNSGMKEATAEKRARDAALKYAEKQHRQRAYTIASTELAYAYNKGQHEGIRQAMAQGFIGRTVSVWRTSHDDSVCPMCAALDGMKMGMDESFQYESSIMETPPAHPRCGCCLDYEEIEPPAWRTAGGMSADSGDLQWEPDDSILPSEPILGKQGDTDGYTTITKVEPFDFSNSQEAAQKLTEFAKTYRAAKTEHALVLSPQNLAFWLEGISISVATRLVGKDGIRDGIVIHNHPPKEDGFADAFSRDDFRELFWGEPAESWLIAGEHTYRMSYSGPPITPAEAVNRYKESLQAIRQAAMETGVPIEAEQLEIMQWLNEHMEGLNFDELS